MKLYEYKTEIITDRGHLNDPEFLSMLNDCGRQGEPLLCPMCGGFGHSEASGWKHKEEQAMGANKLVVLLEREIEVRPACPKLSLVINVGPVA